MAEERRRVDRIHNCLSAPIIYPSCIIAGLSVTYKQVLQPHLVMVHLQHCATHRTRGLKVWYQSRGYLVRPTIHIFLSGAVEVNESEVDFA